MQKPLFVRIFREMNENGNGNFFFIVVFEIEFCSSSHEGIEKFLIILQAWVGIVLRVLLKFIGCWMTKTLN